MIMKRFALAVVVLGMLAFGVGSVMGMHHEIKIKEMAGMGKYLTDTEGNTLYWFKKDSPGKSACAGACLEKWPIYYREKVEAPKPLKAEDFATITREDGKKQTTFKGYPLYYWINDKQPGQMSGQGVNDVWFVIDPDKFPPK
jgi:predicted lipoprotein with Yx(FWY)xxD motif